MCFDPVSMAAMAAVAGGNMLQTQANNKSNKAQMNAKNAMRDIGLQKQQQNQAEAANLFGQTMDKFQEPAQQQSLGELVTKRADAYDASLTPATGIDPASNVSNAPKVVMSDLAKKMSDAVAFGKQQGGAMAKIGATGDQSVGNSLTLGNSGRKLATASDFAKGDARTNAARQLEEYNNAKKAPSMIGQLLSTAGSMALMAGGPNVANGASNMANNAGVWWDTGANIFPPNMAEGMYGPNVPSIFG